MAVAMPYIFVVNRKWKWYNQVNKLEMTRAGGIRMWMYLIPIIIGVVLALFSENIDKVLKGKKQLKKVIRVFGCGVIIVCMIAAVASVLN